MLDSHQIKNALNIFPRVDFKILLASHIDWLSCIHWYLAPFRFWWNLTCGQLWPQDGSIFKAGYQPVRSFLTGHCFRPPFNLILINVPFDFMGQTTLVLLAVMDWHTCSCINKSMCVGDRKRGTCYVYKKYSAFMWSRILLLPENSTLPPNLRTLHHNFFCSSNLPYLDWPFLTFLQPC